MFLLKFKSHWTLKNFLLSVQISASRYHNFFCIAHDAPYVIGKVTIVLISLYWLRLLRWWIECLFAALRSQHPRTNNVHVKKNGCIGYTKGTLTGRHSSVGRHVRHCSSGCLNWVDTWTIFGVHKKGCSEEECSVAKILENLLLSCILFLMSLMHSELRFRYN